MLNPAASVPVAGRVTVVHPAGSGPVVCSLMALTICGAVSCGASVPVPVEDDDELPVGVPGVSGRSSTMAAAPAPAPSTASSTSTSHNPVRRLRGRPAAGAGRRPPDGGADPGHGAVPGPAAAPAPGHGCADGAGPDRGAGSYHEEKSGGGPDPDAGPGGNPASPAEPQDPPGRSVGGRSYARFGWSNSVTGGSNRAASPRTGCGVVAAVPVAPGSPPWVSTAATKPAGGSPQPGERTGEAEGDGEGEGEGEGEAASAVGT